LLLIGSPGHQRYGFGVPTEDDSAAASGDAEVKVDDWISICEMGRMIA
jgi:hypothetical protein